MKLCLALGALLPMTYAQISEHLIYPTFIESFSYSWTNPDYTTTSASTFVEGTATNDFLTNDDLVNGYRLNNPYTNGMVWGNTSAPSSVGFVGTFTANTLAVPTGYAYWDISAASLSFRDDCVGDASTGSMTYRSFFGGASRTVAVTVTHDSTTGVTTFTADTSGDVWTTGPVTFNMQSNTACEGFVRVTEFKLVGEAIPTPEPTTDPTNNPTVPPTTAEPTMAPTAECGGEITWGDPHFTLMGMAGSASQFNYQGLGWFYYTFPCDLSSVEEWPFFILSYHTRCYWRGNPKGCINNNRLVLNTHPNPWIITFTDDGISSLVVGTDVVHTSGDFRSSYTKSQLQGYTKSNPWVINYNDGGDPIQYGQLQIYYDGSKFSVALYDVAFYAKPRTCNKGQSSGLACGAYECDGHVTTIRNDGSWTWISCPACLRNIACGLMGQYTRGDCTNRNLASSTHDCYNILKTPDGTSITPPVGDTKFGQFADTWSKSNVDSLITAAGKTLSIPDTEKERIFVARSYKTQDLDAPHLDGRGIPITYDDLSLLDGYCQNDAVEVARVNETCRLNTMEKYKECCDEIGFCSVLWKACIEDLCGCHTPDAPANITEAWCLQKIVHESMNTTCSNKEFWPTASPTPAPTPSPVFSINGLIQSEKTNPLLIPMLVFAGVIVIILIVACVWWAKKNKGQAYVPDDMDPEAASDGVPTYAQT